ncbi:MAG: 5'-methylthioadenosine/S-adenosylhomocysteine nucleosidase [Deltaproteobacteria bacterium]|nr:5'-methylthioadenosine/S-adenosylhomocysteine nucleosidase [Deltaproteobacteria bacterium]
MQSPQGAKLSFDFGFVIPLQAEARPLLDTLKNRKHRDGSRTIYTGLFHNKKVSLIISGCGKIKSASATQYLIDGYPARTYIHYGTAGALSDKLNIGDIVIATQVIEHDVVELFPKKVPPPVHKIFTERLKRQLKGFHGSPLVWGSILSGDEDIITAKRKKM